MTTVQQFASIGLYDFNLSEYGKLKVIGTTDMFSSCCCCGKQNLKKVAVMQDSENNYSFFGTSCAYDATRNYGQNSNRNRKVHAQVMTEIFKTLQSTKIKPVDVKELTVNKAMTDKGWTRDQAVKILVAANGDLEKFKNLVNLFD